MTTPTIPVSSVPPTTHPLGEGEGVYKLTTSYDTVRLKSLMTAFKSMPKKDVAKMFIGAFERVVRVKKTGAYLAVLPTMGYIESEKKQTDYYRFTMTGYDVAWQEEQGIYKNFESELLLVSMHDIVVLSNEEFVEEIRDGQFREQ